VRRGIRPLSPGTDTRLGSWYELRRRHYDCTVYVEDGRNRPSRLAVSVADFLYERTHPLSVWVLPVGCSRAARVRAEAPAVPRASRRERRGAPTEARRMRSREVRVVPTALLRRCRVAWMEGAEQPPPPFDPDAGGAIEPGAIVRRAGPRLLRDGFGPLATFFLGWKLIGLTAGIVLAVVFGVGVFLHERRQHRPAALVRVALAVVCLRALVGVSSGSASVYLAQEIGIDLLLGLGVLGSLAVGRPISAWIAADVYPFTAEMRDSDTFRQVMRTVTAVSGSYFLARAAVRLVALLTLSTDRYVLVVALSDAPFLIALLAWSVYYTVAAFRRSEQWGALLADAELTGMRAGP
jgi:hypothetical protein